MMEIILVIRVRTTGEGYHRSHVAEVFRGPHLLSHAVRAVSTGDGLLDTAKMAMDRAGVYFADGRMMFDVRGFDDMHPHGVCVRWVEC